MATALESRHRDDKYTLSHGRVFLSGTEALVRLLLVQRRRDAAAGLGTAGFVSGYRGSPLGGLDFALSGAQAVLERERIRFQPGLNEELAATAVWGTQQLELLGPAECDGVFALWYGKGPGVDRAGDVFKHANFAGTARHGGVLLVAGDDHAAASSTLPHQSDQVFGAASIPVLHPADVQDLLDLGVHGFALSRYSGLCIGFKTLAATVEGSALVDADPARVRTQLPREHTLPPGGVNARRYAGTLGEQARAQETLLLEHKLPAALAYARANALNRVTIDAPRARLGIAAVGKSYAELREALGLLGIGEPLAAAFGLRVFKIGMPWPLEPETAQRFAAGLEEILVLEEKSPLVETQLAELLYAWRDDLRPRLLGKSAAARREPLLAAAGELSSALIARVLAACIGRHHPHPGIAARAAALAAIAARVDALPTHETRPAHYCAGCPHSTSTRLPEGSVALAGIGCHIMAAALDPAQHPISSQMGGEGAAWIGQAAFSKRGHVFANLGDGTYFHSGALAIRAAVAAGVDITYKILFNDAVAMTGGQAVDGTLTVPRLVAQLRAEGVRRIAVVAAEPARHRAAAWLMPDVTLHPKRALLDVERELRGITGVSVLVYDQLCSTELRRRRKRGDAAPPARRIYINAAVCEGCGDCNRQSNCTAVLPLDTPDGRKRTIDQAACNVDLACHAGHCPSFVTLDGAVPRRRPVGAGADTDWSLPEPVPAGIDDVFNVLVTGIGGSGVVSLGALLGAAAAQAGLEVSVLDMTGMSQKNGAVTSQVRLAAVAAPGAAAIPDGAADLLLGGDLVTSALPQALRLLTAGRTAAVVNDHELPSGPSLLRGGEFPGAALRATLATALGRALDSLDATALAQALVGDALGANMLLLGYACQRGHLPLSPATLETAIARAGVQVAFNLGSFRWGRRAAVDPARVLAAAGLAPGPCTVPTLDALIDRHAAALCDYQNPAYAAVFRSLVGEIRRAEAGAGCGEVLTRRVADTLKRLMAYKDEYEVARLHTSPEFAAALAREFAGDWRLSFHFEPAWLHRGTAGKWRFGAWVRPVLKLLARAKFLRGTRWDPFGRQADRRLERALVADYRALVRRLAAGLTPTNHPRALELASVFESVRGFGRVKAAAAADARAALARGLATWPAATPATVAGTGRRREPPPGVAA